MLGIGIQSLFRFWKHYSFARFFYKRHLDFGGNICRGKNQGLSKLVVIVSFRNFTPKLFLILHSVRLAAADGWCWFVVREKYCWLAVAGGWCWFGVREKYCWPVAAEQSDCDQGYAWDIHALIIIKLAKISNRLLGYLDKTTNNLKQWNKIN